MKQSGTPLSQLLARVRKAATQTIAQTQVATIQQLVHRCFVEQREPDGTPWPERADGSGRPLLLTIEPALEFYSDGQAVYVDCPSKPHADFQFYGTRTIPSRKWTPPPGMPLPPRWQKAVDAAVRKALRDAMRS